MPMCRYGCRQGTPGMWANCNWTSELTKWRVLYSLYKRVLLLSKNSHRICIRAKTHYSKSVIKEDLSCHVYVRVGEHALSWLLKKLNDFMNSCMDVTPLEARPISHFSVQSATINNKSNKNKGTCKVEAILTPFNKASKYMHVYYNFWII